MKYLSRGFTIVELLVVVIVIGIIASISIVSYNGVQDRAEFSRAQTDMKHINDALTIYRAKNGQYPSTSGWTYQYPTAYSSALNTGFLSALVPSYLDSMPVGKTNPSYWYYSYAYISNGTDYKLIRIAAKSSTAPITGLTAVEKTNNQLLDSGANRQEWAWGYWSAGALNW